MADQQIHIRLDPETKANLTLHASLIGAKRGKTLSVPKLIEELIVKDMESNSDGVLSLKR